MFNYIVTNADNTITDKGLASRGDVDGLIYISNGFENINIGDRYVDGVHYPDTEKHWRDVRSKRDALLSECDWTMVSDAPTDKVAWTAYRQALRDLPDTQSHVTSFDDIVWPTQPEE